MVRCLQKINFRIDFYNTAYYLIILNVCFILYYSLIFNAIKYVVNFDLHKNKLNNPNYIQNLKINLGIWSIKKLSQM